MAQRRRVELKRLAGHADSTVFDPHTELPSHLRIQFILTGYRVDYTTRDCMRSLFIFHNETLNVWTHLLGLFVFIAVHIYATNYVLRNELLLDREMCHLFFVTAELCMMFRSALGENASQYLTTPRSFTYHLFACHMNANLARFLLRMDLTGICLLIGGSFIPGLFYGFYCYPMERLLYCSVNAAMVLTGLLAAHVPLDDHPHLATVRTFFYASIVATAVVPIWHWLSITPWSIVFRFSWKLFLMLALYGAGFAVWYTRVPERFWPGRFDFFLSSHQIWHVLVVLAALVWAWEMDDYYRWIHREGCAPYHAS